ncbi:MAG: hypothetical protein ACOC2U_05650 [bacterium]
MNQVAKSLDEGVELPDKADYSENLAKMNFYYMFDGLGLGLPSEITEHNVTIKIEDITDFE